MWSRALSKNQCKDLAGVNGCETTLGGDMLCFPPQACSLPSGCTRISATRRRHACRYTSSFQPEVPLLQSTSKQHRAFVLVMPFECKMARIIQTDRKTMQYKCHVLEIYWMHQNISKSILLTLPLWVLLALTLLPTLPPIYFLLYFPFLKPEALLQLTHHLSLSRDQTTSMCDFISSMECKRRIKRVIFHAIITHGDWGFQAF